MPLQKKKSIVEIEEVEDRQELEAESRRHAELLELVATWPPWRRKVRRLVDHRYFEYVVWLTIGLTCCTLALANVAAAEPVIHVLNLISDSLAWLYLGEVVLRFAACGKTEFLRHWWNLFDVLLVIISLVGFFMDFAQPVRFGRVLRIIRPLRTLSKAGPMQLVVDAIMACARKLLYVSLFCFIFGFGLTIIALFLFRFDMSYRCVELSLALVYQTNITRTTLDLASSCITSSFPHNYSFDNASLALLTSGLHRVVATPALLPADPVGTVCDYGSLCIRTFSIESGYSNFDTLVTTQSTLFSLLLPDDYGDVMFQLMDNHGWAASYFTVSVLVLGTFFVLLLPLAVVVDKYSAVQNKLEKRAREGAGHAVEAEDEQEEDPNEAASSFFSLSLARQFSPEDLAEWFGARRTSLWDKIHDARLFIRRNVVFRSWWRYLIVGVVAANALLLSTAYAGMSEEHKRTVDLFSKIFICFFLLEVVVNLFAIPLKVWIRDAMNVFDLAVTAASVADLFWTQGGFVGLLRVVRLFRLLTAFKSLRRTTAVLLLAFKSSWPLMLVLIMLLFVFSLVGVQLFGGTMCGLGKDMPFTVNTTFCADVPRGNFDNVGFAFTFLITVAAGDGWRPLANLVSLGSDSEYPAYFFIICRVICGFLFLNLFVATITCSNIAAPIENDVIALFPSLEVSEADEQPAGTEGDHRGVDDLENVELRATAHTQLPETAKQVTSVTNDDFHESNGFLEVSSQHASRGEGALLRQLEQSLLGLVPSRSSNVFDAALSSSSNLQLFASKIVLHPYFVYASSCLSLVAFFSVAAYSPTSYPDHSLNTVQQALDVVFALLYTTESILLIIHLRPWIFRYFDSELVEIVERPGYFRDPWRLFEFVLLLCNISASILVPLSSLASVRPHYRYVVEWLRIARTLRVWTIVTKFKSLSLIFGSLSRSAPSLLNAGVVTFFIFISFSIMGTQLFMGDIYACQHEEWGDVTFGAPHLQNRSDCLRHGFKWKTAPQNFDNTLNSFATLFQVAVRSEWTNIVWAATDGSGADTAPQPLHNPWAPVFFFIFVLLVSFFQVNVFVAAMIDAYFSTKAMTEEKLALLRVAKQRHFKKQQRRASVVQQPLVSSPSLLLPNGGVAGGVSSSASSLEDSPRNDGYDGRDGAQEDAEDDDQYGIEELTKAEQDFYLLYRNAVYHMRPPLLVTFTKGSAMWAIRKFVRSPRYETLLFSMAVFQVFFVAISYSRFEDAVSLTGIQAENFFLNIVIAIVTALKALVTGMSYFRQNRNCVDTAVNIIALAGDFSALSGSPQFVSDGIRLVQLARLYRLAFLQREIMVLLRTLSSSIKNFTVTSFVLMAVVFQFAFVGQVLFGRVKWTTRSGLCKFSNFDRFDVAVYTLVRVGVGAAGLTLMETNCAISPPDCDPNLGDCGWPIVAPLFKIVFMVFVNWIGVNLVSAVLLEGLSNSERQESFAIKPEDVDDFGHMWKAVAVYDRSKGSVTFRELWSLLLRLQRSSLGVEGKNPLHVALRLGRLPLRKLRKSEGRGGGQPVIFKRHVFHGLVDSLYGVELPRRHKRELERILESRFRDVEQEKQLVAEEATLDTLAAALTIQRLFRSSRKKGERDSSRAAANRRSE